MTESFTLTRAARLTGLRTTVLQRLIERGDLPARQVSTDHGDIYLVDRDDLLALTTGEPTANEEGTGSGFRPDPEPPPARSPLQPSPIDASAALPDSQPGARVGTPTGEVPAPSSLVPAPSPYPYAPSYPSTYASQPFVVESPAPGGAVGGRIMLSVEWAGAIKEYSHTLISPLVDLLREKDARLEKKGRLIQSQTEVLARLRLEVEQQRAEIERLRADVEKLRGEGDRRVADQQKEIRSLRIQLQQSEATLRMLHSQGSSRPGENESHRRWWWPFGD